MAATSSANGADDVAGLCVCGRTRLSAQIAWPGSVGPTKTQPRRRALLLPSNRGVATRVPASAALATALFRAATAGAGNVLSGAPATLTICGVVPCLTTATDENPPGAFVIKVAVC